MADLVRWYVRHTCVEGRIGPSALYSAWDALLYDTTAEKSTDVGAVVVEKQT